MLSIKRIIAELHDVHKSTVRIRELHPSIPRGSPSVSMISGGHDRNLNSSLNPATPSCHAQVERRRKSRECGTRPYFALDSRYDANPSSDPVFFRRRCNDLMFPWRAVAHYW